MAANGWKDVLDMTRLVIKLLNFTTRLLNLELGTDCLGLEFPSILANYIQTVRV